MTQKQTEEVYLMEKLQHFAAIREKQQAQQTQQSSKLRFMLFIINIIFMFVYRSYTHFCSIMEQ